MAAGTGSNRGTGGMITKLHAADYATKRGVEVSVINGSNPENLYEVIDGKKSEQNFYLLNNRRKIMTTLEQMGAKAKDASRFLMTAGSKKDIALGAIADALCENCEEILAANKIDLENGEKSGLTASLLDRLRLSEERINGMADGVRQVAALPDPVGRVLDGRTLKTACRLKR